MRDHEPRRHQRAVRVICWLASLTTEVLRDPRKMTHELIGQSHPPRQDPLPFLSRMLSTEGDKRAEAGLGRPR